MSEEVKEMRDGSFLCVNKEGKAYWGQPEGYPYKEGKISNTLTWDGNTDGLVSVGGSFYKVSDAVPILSDFSNGISFISTYIPDLTEEEVQIPADLINELTPGVVMIGEGEGGIFVSSEGIGTDIGNGLIFDEPGTYFIKTRRGFVSSLTIPGYTGFTKTEVHPMAPEFLPAGASTGGGAFIVNVTMNDGVNYVADKTYAEISEALANGQMPYCIYGTLVFHIMLSSALLNTYQAGNSHNFLCIAPNTLTIFQIEITNNDNVSLIECGKITTTT